MKYFSFILAFLISGCAPHFYKAESVILTSADLMVSEGTNLSENCILEKRIPKTYTLKREKYSLEFEVFARQVGVRVISKDPDISLSINGLDINDSRITRIPSKFMVYAQIHRSGTLKLLLLRHGNQIASESLNVSLVSCRAVVIDGI